MTFDLTSGSHTFEVVYRENGTKLDVLTITKEGNGTAEIVQKTDYYPFGFVMNSYTSNGEKYRFGYQGDFAEDDTEETGFNHFELRDYDSRIGRWTATDPAGQFWSPYVGMGNDPINQVDPDGAYSKAGAWWRSGFGLINPIYQSGQTLDGEKIWGFNGRDGAANFGKAHSRDGVQTLQEWKPDFFDRWSESDNVVSQFFYGAADDYYVTSQMLTFQLNRSHLNGENVTPNDNASALAGSIPIPSNHVAGGLKRFKPLNAPQFSSKFKGTYLARMKPDKLRGQVNVGYNYLRKGASSKSGIMMRTKVLNFTTQGKVLTEAERQGLMDWYHQRFPE